MSGLRVSTIDHRARPIDALTRITSAPSLQHVTHCVPTGRRQPLTRPGNYHYSQKSQNMKTVFVANITALIGEMIVSLPKVLSSRWPRGRTTRKWETFNGCVKSRQGRICFYSTLPYLFNLGKEPYQRLQRSPLL